MQSIAKLPGQGAQRISPTGLTIVIALHGMVVYALLQMNVIKLPLPLPILSVSLLTPSAPVVAKPDIVPPKPRPLEKRPVERPVQTTPTTLLAVPAEAVAVAAAVVEVPVAVSPAPTFTPSAAPAPVEITRPRFDADYLDNPKPHYPALSRRLREEGRVVLRVQVAASGLPLDVALHGSSGFGRLDSAARETVRRWKFVPARHGQEAVAAAVLVPIVFSLKD